ncbi:MAG: archease, partial [Candidatus Micrarchaeota archaeon]
LAELTTYLLNRIVSEGDAREWMFKRMKVLNFEEKQDLFFVEVEAYGQEAVHKLGRMYVKAVTHHEATVEEKKGQWRIKVLPDI